MIEDNHLRGLEKVLIVVPGLNSLPGILKLHVRQETHFSSVSLMRIWQEHTVQTILNFCPSLNKLGNLLSWSVEPHQVITRWLEQNNQFKDPNTKLISKTGDGARSNSQGDELGPDDHEWKDDHEMKRTEKSKCFHVI